MSDASHRSTTVWLQWVVSAGVVAAVIISLWRPPSGIPAPASQQAYRIGALTALLGDPHATAAVIDERVRGFSRFPPDPRASRELADALAMCEPAVLDESARWQLARRLYAITSGDDVENVQRGALIGIQQALVAMHCPSAAANAAITAAWKVARTDPNPRRDWW